MKLAMLTQLWRDERGDTAVTSLILLTTILVIGTLVGLVTVRDQVVQELGDLAQALENVDQSFSYTINGSSVSYIDTVAGDDLPNTSPSGFGWSIDLNCD